MILPFKPFFVEPILKGSKIHTIRKDKSNRWKEGRLIHFATGVRTKKYNKFTEQICLGVQQIEIKWSKTLSGKSVQVFIDGKNITINCDKIDALVKNDGFETRVDFFEWFSEDFSGKIIHWTEYRY